MSAELARSVSLARLPASFTVEADPGELEALTRRFRIEAVQSLSCRFVMRRQGETVLADGALQAEVTQICVVSLEPFEQTVHETFALRFVPSGQETADDDPDSPDELPYEGDCIDLGEAAAEQLALALDPYPRRPGAELEAEASDGAASPFGALAGLKFPH